MGFDKNLAIFAADVAVTMLDIKRICTGTPNFVCLFIEINKKKTISVKFY